MRYADPPGHPDCMRAALTLCPYLAIGRHRRARSDRPGAGTMPAGTDGSKPDVFVVGVTRQYRTGFLPDDGYTLNLPAPFKTVYRYAYGPDGRLHPEPTND